MRIVCIVIQLWQHPRRPTPDYLKVVKPNFSWPVIRRVGFSHFRLGYFTFHYIYARHNRDSGRKKNKRTNKDFGQHQVQVFVTGILTHLWLSSLTASIGWPSFPSTAISRRLVSSAHQCQLILCVFPGTFLPSSTSGLTGDLTLSPLCGFRAKTDKEIVWVVPIQTKTNCYAWCHSPPSLPVSFIYNKLQNI